MIFLAFYLVYDCSGGYLRFLMVSLKRLLEISRGQGAAGGGGAGAPPPDPARRRGVRKWLQL